MALDFLINKKHYLLVHCGDNSDNFTVFNNNFFDEECWGILQTDDFIGCDSVESFLILKFDIAFLDKNFLWNFNLSVSSCFVFGEQRNGDFWLIDLFNDHLNWFKNSHSSRSVYVKVFSDLIFENIKVNIVLISSSGHTNYITEVVDSLCRVASSSHSVNGEHSWVIPAFYSVGENELVKFSLGKHIVGDVQARVLPNIWFVQV